MLWGICFKQVLGLDIQCLIGFLQRYVVSIPSKIECEVIFIKLMLQPFWMVVILIKLGMIRFQPLITRRIQAGIIGILV